ncbi:MAG: 7-carboxy-7-deazaguanine synthase QueE [Candidatus Omnitrophica bacterium]|nr:7-carboxy-7-deazaguanine synthase QueE [Candidatus Omnitrophota bacterium]MCF7892018.1 7-carboxy-7-deazaguanine synthase QueE [Candidatus Omnitrophota bacterium]MCF7895511.1 7-carboxy-7-deazaguanine synthase QueE [Candidatus Omnitrophota bacterium]MCF7909766.1 7-carboxy-7-deazaguanine synthase QueE [Candidatus Omnitrophota bacterium]
MKIAKIDEIFKSYQGEGPWQGKEQLFLRFFGCNLSCKFCDTEQKSYRLMSVAQVREEIDSLGEFHSISLTGGEPLLQVDFIEDFLSKVKKTGKIIYLETNGILYRNLAKIVDFVDMVSIDFKLPSSTGRGPLWGMHEKFIKAVKNVDAYLKVVVGKNTTIDDLDKTLTIIKKNRPDLLLVLQPENPYEDLLKEKLSNFKKRCRKKSVFVKIISQMHKKTGIR